MKKLFGKIDRQIYGDVVTAAVFLAIVAGFAVFIFINMLVSFTDMGNGVKDDIKKVLSSPNSFVPLKNEIIDLNGLEYLFLQKSSINDATTTVMKGTDGYLYIPLTENDDSEPSVHITLLANYIAGKDIPFLYISAPYKSGYRQEYLPGGVTDGSTATREKFLSAINANGILYMDLEDGDIQYYKTDHHWTIESSLETAISAMQRLGELGLQIEYDEEVSDRSNYSSEVLENAFLGSIGRRVGALYAGKDDFNYLTPTFETSLSFEHRIDGKVEKDSEKEGGFPEALISAPQETEQAQDYYNTYMNNAYDEVRVENGLSQNDKKLLIVGDSYARPAGAFLSLYFKETRVLDIQKGRYDESILEYIDAYEPDAVIVLLSDSELNVQGAYDFGVDTNEWQQLAKMYVSKNLMEGGGLYIRLLNSLVDIEAIYAGRINDAFSDSHQEVANILYAEVLCQQKDPVGSESEKIIYAAVDWLIKQSDFDRDGEYGWGSVEPFGDFPENVEYAITNANVMEALMFADEKGFLSNEQHDQTGTIFKSIVITWCREYWTETDSGLGYFYYAAYDDTGNIVNTSAQLAGIFQKVITLYPELFTDAERAMVEARIDGAVNEVIAQRKTVKNLSYWP
jgi:hypothetical protein